MGLYGATLTQRGETGAALPVLREAVDMAVRFAGPASPVAVQDRHFLTEALAAAGNLPAARATLRENLATALGQFGPDHLLTLRLQLAQARLALLAGQPAEAHAQVTALLPALRAASGQSGPWIAHSQVVAGEALLALGRPREAAAPLREAVLLREQLLAPESWELAEARARLGEALAAAGDPEGARLLAAAATALRSELGPAHPQTLRADRALAALNERQSRPRP
jgi:tetratricopeptide (TPR) repeat protein